MCPAELAHYWHTYSQALFYVCAFFKAFGPLGALFIGRGVYRTSNSVFEHIGLSDRFEAAHPRRRVNLPIYRPLVGPPGYFR